ncbi:MAG: hypothetical protein IKU03_05435 [Bacteroidales bacterium]|nr:hypothetical protein [Bacteroidales bacterium]
MSASAIIIGLCITLPFFAGMCYFIYRYQLSKQRGVREHSYDLSGMIFLMITFWGGGSSMVGRCLEGVIPNANPRLLTASAIILFVILLTFVIIRHIVKRKVAREKQA